MTRALITGVNGHLGSNLARFLLTKGVSVRGLVRPTSDLRGLAGLDVELVKGDMRDARAVRAAMEGVDALFHAAAPTVVRGAEDRSAVMEGARHVFDAMRDARVRKAVYVSSIVTVGVTSDPRLSLDENSFQRLSGTPYQEVKWESEAWVRSYLAETGLPVVIVNPSTIVGPGDWRPTPPNRLVVEFLNDAGGLTWLRNRNFKVAPIYFSGGFSVVDVEDVCDGMWRALERGRPGERYILGGDNVTLRQFFTDVAEITHLTAPWIFAPRPFLLAASFLLTQLMDHPPMSYDLAKSMVGRYSFFSSEKARRELGYSWRPHREAVARTVKWFLNTPLVRSDRRDQLQPRLAKNSII